MKTILLSVLLCMSLFSVSALAIGTSSGGGSETFEGALLSQPQMKAIETSLYEKGYERSTIPAEIKWSENAFFSFVKWYTKSNSWSVFKVTVVGHMGISIIIDSTTVEQQNP